MPRVLVIMPCYNAMNTVIEALECVVKQKYKDYLLVCCDDKSTDDTYNILKKYKDKFEYELLNNEVNMGTGMTVNKCIEYCKNLYNFEYYTWISADNIIFTNFLEEHVNKLDKGYAITYSGWTSFKGKKQNRNYIPNKNILHLKNNFNLGPSFMFRKSLYDKTGPFNKFPGEDYLFAVKCCLEDAKFGYIDNVLVNYRIHDNSVSGRLIKNKNNKNKIFQCSTLAKKEAQKIIKSNGNNNYINE